MDRFQRWRQIGSLYDYATDASPLRFMANESLYFDYEARIQHEMAEMNALEVTLWDAHTHPGGWSGGYSSTVEVALPDADTLAQYDAMAIYLYTACPTHEQGKDAGCNEWDFIQNLFLCDVGQREAVLVYNVYLWTDAAARPELLRPVARHADHGAPEQEGNRDAPHCMNQKADFIARKRCEVEAQPAGSEQRCSDEAGNNFRT